MKIAEQYFGKLLGVYAPKTIEDVSKKFDGKWTGSMCPRCTFNDGSFIETVGNEVVFVSDVGGSEDVDNYDHAAAYFAGFGNL